MSFRPSQVSESQLQSQKNASLANFKFSKKFKTLAKQQIDFTKINKPILINYITTQLVQFLGLDSPQDDDITIDFIKNLIVEENVHPEELCLQILPFLNNDTETTIEFVMDIWEKLKSAQDDRDGIPTELLKQRELLIESQQQQYESKIIGRERDSSTASPSNYSEKSTSSIPNSTTRKFTLNEYKAKFGTKKVSKPTSTPTPTINRRIPTSPIVITPTYSSNSHHNLTLNRLQENNLKENNVDTKYSKLESSNSSSAINHRHSSSKSRSEGSNSGYHSDRDTKDRNRDRRRQDDRRSDDRKRNDRDRDGDTDRERRTEDRRRPSDKDRERRSDRDRDRDRGRERHRDRDRKIYGDQRSNRGDRDDRHSINNDRRREERNRNRSRSRSGSPFPKSKHYSGRRRTRSRTPSPKRQRVSNSQKLTSKTSTPSSLKLPLKQIPTAPSGGLPNRPSLSGLPSGPSELSKS